jgi:hypothetical protein
MLTLVAGYGVIAVLLTVINNRKSDVYRQITCFGTILIGAGIYLISMFLLYVFSFYNHGITYGLPSFHRYMSTYTIGMIVCLLIPLLAIRERITASEVIDKTKEIISFELRSRIISLKLAIHNAEVVCYAFIVFFFLMLGTTQPSTYRTFLMDVALVRVSHSERYVQPSMFDAEKWRPYLAEQGDSPLVYIISQHPDGWWLSGRMGRRDIYPYARALMWGVSNIQVENLPEDTPAYPPPPTKFSAEEWEEFVLSQNTTFVYIDIYDEPFVEHYGHFFEGEVRNQMLYEVIKKDGHMSLVPVIWE